MLYAGKLNGSLHLSPIPAVRLSSIIFQRFTLPACFILYTARRRGRAMRNACGPAGLRSTLPGAGHGISAESAGPSARNLPSPAGPHVCRGRPGGYGSTAVALTPARTVSPWHPRPGLQRYGAGKAAFPCLPPVWERMSTPFPVAWRGHRLRGLPSHGMRH